jgi:predicted short-subunit dehydrogenase-like oxidoreductase (DUF2520 family)
MKIVLIGAGNVATVLGKLLLENGFTIQQIVGRSTEKLSALLKAEAVFTIEQISREADLYIIAIPDDAVLAIAEKLQLPGKLVVHTAGTLPLNSIQKISENIGVIWPLQSLRKEIEHIPEIPFVLDGSNEYVLMLLNRLLSGISNDVLTLKDAERVKLHLSAVMVSNFTNHLYALAQEYCNQNDLPYDILNPLILETASRLKNYEAKDIQTGPSVRRDNNTVLSHLKLLENNEQLKAVYTLFEHSIKEMYKK